MYRNSDLFDKIALTSAYDGISNSQSARSLFNEIAELPSDPNRHNRLCVALSDIHLTDGTVGFQNLSDVVWDNFFAKVTNTCFQSEINECVIVLDGDVIDIIRSGLWAERNHYPWQRENKALFDEIVLQITKDIISQHTYFFEKLRSFDADLKSQCPFVQMTDVIILLGNHDKELMLCNEALSYFYEHALGRKPENFGDTERAYIGRMYGDKDMFLEDKSLVPYFPFYHADRGFRFFSTHGQWRDAENSRAIESGNGKPGWSSKDGWKPDVWEKLNYAPFLDACFGDTVAAGVLSTFIYRTKKQLSQMELNDEKSSVQRLERILDELDLYRPSYLAVKRIIHESRALRKKNPQSDAANIIEDNLTACIRQWLSWDFTFDSASKPLRIGLKAAKVTLKGFKIFGKSIELGAILKIMETLAFFSHHKKTGVDLKKMKTFPGFQHPYIDRGFQIHGEGHTHNPLEEEANISVVKTDVNKDANTNFTYVNFGTWRDQIVNRQKSGYRRRGVLRAFNILDLRPDPAAEDKNSRRFIYYTQDYVIWRDSMDRIEQRITVTEKAPMV